MPKYVMAFDSGTTSNRCIIFDRKGNIISVAQRELNMIYPEPGWVEQDANQIWATQLAVAVEAMQMANISADEIASIGITNQRETTIVWDRTTGEPVYNAIVWQCRRTSKYCDELIAEGRTDFFKKKTGLLIDAYFSATKLKWILDNVPGARERAEKGELLFGTVDSWLVWKLTKGNSHITDYSNASRTLLFNIHELRWDRELLDFFGIPASMLPQVMDSSKIYDCTDESFFGKKIPLSGIAGDQQSALFGQACFSKGDIKNTYGTGGFLLMNTGDTIIDSKQGLLSTIAWGIDGKVSYALEGSVFTSGATIQWLRDEMGLISSAAESEEIAASVEDSNGCYFVPAFTGLGAPYWDSSARGTIVGLTRGVSRSHVVRAALESLAYQSYDDVKTMEAEMGEDIGDLGVDGGASANDLLLKIQADILGRKVIRPKCIETTALGAAYLSGLAVGFWKDMEELRQNWATDRVFAPDMDEDRRDRMLKGWHKAVEKAKDWAD